jgi:hypothetical protein
VENPAADVAVEDPAVVETAEDILEVEEAAAEEMVSAAGTEPALPAGHTGARCRDCCRPGQADWDQHRMETCAEWSGEVRSIRGSSLVHCRPLGRRSRCDWPADIAFVV